MKNEKRFLVRMRKEKFFEIEKESLKNNSSLNSEIISLISDGLAYRKNNFIPTFVKDYIEKNNINNKKIVENFH